MDLAGATDPRMAPLFPGREQRLPRPIRPPSVKGLSTNFPLRGF
jgi:hypothetical protein